MKKILYILSAIVLLATLSSCEDFFNREPINEFSAESYFSNETQLEMYANGMINSYMPDYTEPASGDQYNDLIATKTSSDFYRSDVEWDGTKQTGWSYSSWAFLRRVNYMLNNMSNAKDAVDEDIYNHYEGVARFWRAYQYMSKIRTFSNVPWITTVVQPTDSTILFGERDDREYVFHMMTEDLLFACENCMADKFQTDGRVYINKYVVNTYASRFFLYEATFRMNFPYNPSTGKEWTNEYETPEQLLQYAAQCAKRVIDSGEFSLISDYESLFLSQDLQADEVIWGRARDVALTGYHSLTRYFHSSTLGQQPSGTKDLVRMFLKTDGTPVTTGETSILDEFSGRDQRLAATVLGPGREITLGSSSGNEYMDFTWTKTGYEIIKWSIKNSDNWQNSVDDNSLPILRYAEVLLNYAEAMNELEQMTEEIWNMTVGALRERAGVKNIYPESSSYVEDSWLRSYYTTGLSHQPTLSNIALEIRRERVTELTFESELRVFDLYRYAQADLIARRSAEGYGGWVGIWIGESEAENGFDFEGRHYSFELASTGAANTTLIYPIKSKSTAVNTDWYFSEENYGYLIYVYDLHWDDRMYCRPIPQDALLLNPNLGQNYQW